MDLKLVLEISVYFLVDFVPNVLFSLIPFRNYLRFGKRTVVISIVLIYIFQVFARIAGIISLQAATILSVLLILIYLLFFGINVKVEPIKLLFVLLIMLNFGSFIAIVYSYFTHYFLSENSRRIYSLSSSALYGLVVLCTSPIIILLMEKKIRPLISSGVNNRMWRYLWMVPATSCLSYYYNLFSNGGTTEFSKELNNVLFAVFFISGSLFVTFLVSQLLKESNDSLLLKSENYMLNLQTLQYENLQSRIEETRRARHDFRQIITLINSCLQDDDIARLRDYISQYTETLPSNAAIIYCENYALNALIVYYADKANTNGINFSASVNFLLKNGLSDSDLVILFGNLLENALEACLRQEQDEAFISLTVKELNNILIITIDNSYSDIIRKAGHYFKSSKGDRIGVGISSIEKIAHKYNGSAQFEYGNHVFKSSVLLNVG